MSAENPYSPPSNHPADETRRDLRETWRVRCMCGVLATSFTSVLVGFDYSRMGVDGWLTVAMFAYAAITTAYVTLTGRWIAGSPIRRLR